MVVFAMNTGLRREELFTLTWEQIEVHGESGGEVVRVDSGKAKSLRTRRVPLNAASRSVLDEVGRRSSGLIFPSPITGRARTDIRQAFYRVLTKTQIDNFKWHDLRHTFASRLAMNSVDLNTIRELMGHSDLTMTLRYAHLSPGHLQEAVETL